MCVVLPGGRVCLTTTVRTGVVEAGDVMDGRHPSVHWSCAVTNTPPAAKRSAEVRRCPGVGAVWGGCFPMSSSLPLSSLPPAPQLLLSSPHPALPAHTRTSVRQSSTDKLPPHACRRRCEIRVCQSWHPIVCASKGQLKVFSHSSHLPHPPPRPPLRPCAPRVTFTSLPPPPEACGGVSPRRPLPHR